MHAASNIPEVDLEIDITLRRLELQILSFLAMNPSLEHPFNNLNIEELVFNIPERFVTFNQAFASATYLAVSVLRHARTSARYRDDIDSRDSTAQQQRSLQELVDQWNKAYESLFLEVCQNNVGREYLGALQVRICVWKLEIVIATSMSASEIIFDSYTTQFQRIAHFARHLLHKDQEIRDADGSRLQYGMGGIMALFYTATRCRDLCVRRDVIAILREWPSTNGIWHSLQAATVAEWIASIEGKACNGRDPIPETCRVRLHTLKVTFKKGLITTECMQPSICGDLELRKANLRWP